MYVTVVPVVIFWLIQAARVRNLAFFTAINPGLYMGGMYGNSKDEINSKIASELLPISVTISIADLNVDTVQRAMSAHDLEFPIILKPDVGERGLNVFLIENTSDLERHIPVYKTDVLLQEYIDYTFEMSVLCYSIPGVEEGVTSICLKDFLTVTGRNDMSIGQLIDENPRAQLQKARLSKSIDLDVVPDAGQLVLLEPIGNHNRGTKFLNGSKVDRKKLAEVFLPIMLGMNGVYFGRFDLKAESLQSVLDGRNFKIIEFNGVNSEPVHVYDPDYSIFRAYGDFWKQWQLMRRIAQHNIRSGVTSEPASRAWSAFRDYLAYKSKAQKAARDM